jgi:probable HAF family extracellular repeat protein
MPTYLIATLDDPSGSVGTVARGINNSGQITGYYSFNGGPFTNGGSSGFEELTPGNITSFDVQTGSGPPSTVATGINNAAQISGYSSGLLGSFEATEGFIYNQGAVTHLAQNTHANGINDIGHVVGTNGQLGFIYDGNTYTTLVDPLAQGPKTTEANGTNNSDQVVGDFYDGSTFHGFLYSNGNYTTLDGPLGVQGTFAEGINDLGQIVGYYADGNGLDHGFLYSGGTYSTIDDPNGAKGTIAYGINDHGAIVGTYVDAGGVSHGFLAASPVPFASTDWQLVGVGDFNGDGKADLAWQHTPDHQVQLQFFNGTTPTGSGPIANSPFDSGWSVAAQADFNGDGNQDLVYRHTSDGLTEVQLLQGSTGIGGGAIANNPFDASWNIAATGDFNGDGKSDLAWLRPSDGVFEEQFLNGSVSLGGGIVAGNPFGTDWHIVASGDFNGDSKTDLVWQRPSDGLVEIELLDGLKIVGGGAILNSPFGKGWNVVGAGDFNGDVHADLVWRHTGDGLTEIQFLSGITPVGGGVITNNPFDSSWSVAGVGDFNGDGHPDLVWRHAGDGLTEIQYLNGINAIGGGIAAGLGLGTHAPQLLNI